MASFRGKKCCSCLAKWLPAYEAELLRRGVIQHSLDVYQLTGKAKASAGTHAGGGAFDTGQYSRTALEVARQMGADATWHRRKSQGFDVDHAHGVLRGCPHNGPARYQIAAVDAGFNGLGAGGRGGRDDGPRPLSKRTWREGLVWVKRFEAKPPNRVQRLRRRHKQRYVARVNAAGRSYPRTGRILRWRRKGQTLTSHWLYTDPEGRNYVRTRLSGAWYATSDLKLRK